MLFAAAALSPSGPDMILCSTWTDLRRNPPSDATVVAFVEGNIDMFNVTTAKDGPTVKVKELLALLDKDCKKSPRDSLGHTLLIDEFTLAMKPPPN